MENNDEHLSVVINKEIKEYREEVVLGLDMKTCIIFLIAIVLCVVEWFYFAHTLHVKNSIMSAVYVLTVLPFGFLAVYKYEGYTAWELIKIWFKFYFLQGQHLEYRPENRLKKRKGDK